MSGWTEAEDAVLRAEWQHGHTASVIARMISARFGTRRSRNSVIGRKYRLKLPDRVTPVRIVRAKKRVRKSVPSKPPCPFVQTPNAGAETGAALAKQADPVGGARNGQNRAQRPPESAIPEEPMRRVEISELARNECRWGVNDPSEGEVHLFCGRKQADGSSYCAAHLERSISKQSESTRKVQPVSRKVAYS